MGLCFGLRMYSRNFFQDTLNHAFSMRSSLDVAQLYDADTAIKQPILELILAYFASNLAMGWSAPPALITVQVKAPGARFEILLFKGLARPCITLCPSRSTAVSSPKSSWLISLKANDSHRLNPALPTCQCFLPRYKMPLH